MADSSPLKRFAFPKANPSSFFALVTNGGDPDISIDVGTPVAPVTNQEPPVEVGTVYIGNGANAANATIVGLAASANEAGQRINIQYAGPLSQPTEWWDRLTGQTGGLTPGARYYITDQDKVLSTSPDNATFPVQVGIALSADTLLIQIAQFSP